MLDIRFNFLLVHCFFSAYQRFRLSILRFSLTLCGLGIRFMQRYSLLGWLGLQRNWGHLGRGLLLLLGGFFGVLLFWLWGLGGLGSRLGGVGGWLCFWLGLLALWGLGLGLDLHLLRMLDWWIDSWHLSIYRLWLRLCFHSLFLNRSGCLCLCRLRDTVSNIGCFLSNLICFSGVELKLILLVLFGDIELGGIFELLSSLLHLEVLGCILDDVGRLVT